MAEAVFRKVLTDHSLAGDFEVDSCGTAGYHVGEDPDSRTVSVCRSHNVPISHRARKLSREDFEKYDYMLVMDRSNLRDIQEKKPNGSKSIVQLFGSYDAKGVDIIEDPYYSDMSNFENVYQQCYRSSIGFLQKMQLIN